MNTVAPMEKVLHSLPDGTPDTARARKLLAELKRLDTERTANLPKIKHLLKQLAALNTQGRLQNASQFREWVTAYHTEVAALERDLRQRFGTELETCLQQLGLKLTGQYPVLSSGFFTFKMLDEQGQVEIWYGPDQERLDTAAISAAEVMKRIADIRKRLGSQLTPAIFLAKLEEAYQRTPRDAEQPGAAIIRVLPEVAYLIQTEKYYQNPIRENYRSYTRADFSYDLHRCGCDEKTRERLHLSVAVRSYTRNRNDFLWIPNPDSPGGTTYSHLSLKEPAQ